jgi:hypothetical protein
MASALLVPTAAEATRAITSSPPGPRNTAPALERSTAFRCQSSCLADANPAPRIRQYRVSALARRRRWRRARRARSCCPRANEGRPRGARDARAHTRAGELESGVRDVIGVASNGTQSRIAWQSSSRGHGPALLSMAFQSRRARDGRARSRMHGRFQQRGDRVRECSFALERRRAAGQIGHLEAGQDVRAVTSTLASATRTPSASPGRSGCPPGAASRLTTLGAC